MDSPTRYSYSETRAWEQVRALREVNANLRRRLVDVTAERDEAELRRTRALHDLERLTVERNTIADERIRLALRLDDAAEMLEALPDVLADLIADSLEMIREQVKR